MAFGNMTAQVHFAQVGLVTALIVTLVDFVRLLVGLKDMREQIGMLWEDFCTVVALEADVGFHVGLEVGWSGEFGAAYLTAVVLFRLLRCRCCCLSCVGILLFMLELVEL